MDGDELLYLGGGQSECLRLHFDRRRRELGEHIPRHVGKPHVADDYHHRGEPTGSLAQR